MENQERPTIECQFCKKTFASKSTYGRHLDSKRQDPLHPASEVDLIRKNVVRRGENSKLDPLRQLRAKSARKKASSIYNSKPDVKERNKRRRRERDVGIKAKLHAHTWYLGKLSYEKQIAAKTFLEMVALYLPPENWPAHGEIPGETEFLKIVGLVSGEVSGALFAAWDQWKKYEGNREEKWRQESMKIMREVLGSTSLHEIGNCCQLVEKKLRELNDEYSNSDVLHMLVSESEGPE